MITATMSNPLDTLKKLKGRTWTELRARSEQALSAYTEQIGLSGKLPSDDEFAQLVHIRYFPDAEVTPKNLFNHFYEVSELKFFPAFRNKEKTVEYFRQFDKKAVMHVIEKAQKITEGKFDLLGFQNLDFGEAFDWHYEPVSGKHIPLKHWKQYDELDAEETGDKKIIWELNRHQHFFTLGVAYWLSKDEIFAETFVQHLESWMEQNPPGIGINWMSSLEVAFRAISWLWALQFFKDSPHLTPEILQKALKFLHVHGRHLEKYLSTYYSPNTHLTGEALGLYYLGTQLPFFKRSDFWRRLGEEILIAELDRQILPDGVYFEQSTWYQRYTVDFYLQFLILKALNGEKTKPELDAKLEAKTQQLIDFLMYITRPDGTTPIIGDDDGGKCLPHSSAKCGDFSAVLSTGAVLFGRGDYKFVAGDFREETLWLLGEDGVDSFLNLRQFTPEKTSNSFKGGGYFVMRDGWDSSDNYLLIDGGNLGALSGGHSHADTLSIDMAAGGRTVLVDPGTYTYHESTELRDYFRSTSAHNTLCINQKSSSEPGGKFGWQTMAQASVSSWISEDRFDFFEGSHDGYKRLENPSEHTRSILFLKNDYWIMRDFVETKGENEYGLNFHFNIETQPEIEGGENGSFCINETPANDVGVKLITFGDNGGWQRKDSWVSTCYGQRVNAPFLRFVSKGIGSQEFFTFMMPTDEFTKAPEVFETEVFGGRAFVIKYRDYNDLFVYADGSDQLIRTEFFDTNFRFLWARLSHGENLPEEFVMVDGTNFSLAGREVINYPSRLKFAVARRLGNKLNVRTSESVFSVSLPQRKSSTYILKNSLQSE
jgi:hypothetical protein